MAELLTKLLDDGLPRPDLCNRPSPHLQTVPTLSQRMSHVEMQNEQQRQRIEELENANQSLAEQYAFLLQHYNILFDIVQKLSNRVETMELTTHEPPSPLIDSQTGDTSEEEDHVTVDIAEVCSLNEEEQ